MASPVRYPSATQSSVYPFSQYGATKPQVPANGLNGVPQFTAHSVEFVAKPEEARRAETALPGAIAGALREVTGFAGCMVMISDHEARIVTVITFWAGDDRVKRCGENVRWVKALLAPYQDRCTRVQTMTARMPVLPMSQQESLDNYEHALGAELASADETVCVA